MGTYGQDRGHRDRIGDIRMGQRHRDRNEVMGGQDGDEAMGIEAFL